MIELEGPDELDSCDLTNPIRMYTDPVTHVDLEKEGTRYFTSRNPESCKNGLKLPVSVQSHEYGPHAHEYGPPPPFGPFPPLEPPPEYAPPEPVRPPPAYGPPPPRPSAATYLNGLSFVLFVGLLASYIGM
ncbi:uclacyanin-3 [Phtheirospermum japonicum]|uniref:Uclacyanin-3 n=1 Tax=Phtheirospermum japonicum TaxID=374723 RepID=A0A830BFY8_9LAMI|nr:uclacyanin-3 [Phtheirospermum japonicum]